MTTRHIVVRPTNSSEDDLKRDLDHQRHMARARREEQALLADIERIDRESQERRIGRTEAFYAAQEMVSDTPSFGAPRVYPNPLRP